MERDRDEQDDQAQRRRPTLGARVDPHEHPHEQVSSQQEMRGHEDVPGVRAQRELEQWREVEDDQATEKDGSGDDRIANNRKVSGVDPVSYTHLRAHETVLDLVCRLLLEKKKKK